MNDDTLSERGNSLAETARAVAYSRNVAREREIAGRDGRFHGAKLARKLTPASSFSTRARSPTSVRK